jgi:hypothetical protein
MIYGWRSWFNHCYYFRVVIIGVILSWVFWFLPYNEYEECIKNNHENATMCLTNKLKSMPPVQEAEEWKRYCNETNSSACILKIAQGVVEKEVSDQRDSNR